jgi:hypothetical protein
MNDPRVSDPRRGVEDLERRLALTFPDGLVNVWARAVPDELSDSLYRPLPGNEPPSLTFALYALRRASQRPPRTLVPLHLVDESSIACVVCARVGELPGPDFGHVVRWHLDDVPPRAQRRLLDIDAAVYVEAIVRAERAVAAGKAKLERAAERFFESHVKIGKAPRAHEGRPLRLACQNVVIGEALWWHDARFDGLNVSVWQTSQEPHVNAHEGARALTAMMLAEAFRSGGTMEIRFDEHPERAVPAALAQWARTVGLSTSDGPVITPIAARDLMLEATALPAGVRRRISQLANAGGFGVERACYAILAGIWSPLELDFMLATSGRVVDILSGGSDPLNRARHEAELEVCRAAGMLGTLFKRLQQRTDGSVLEGDANDVAWETLPEHGAVVFRGFENVPWVVGGRPEPIGALAVLPRAHPERSDLECAAEVGDVPTVALLTPQDTHRVAGRDRVLHLRHPDRLSVIDRSVESRLLQSRVVRK